MCHCFINYFKSPNKAHSQTFCAICDPRQDPGVIGKMDSRDKFLMTIRDEYFRVTKGEVAGDKLDLVSGAVTDYYYDQYQRFGQQYPKSIKRYSTFQLKDLDHPATFEIVIKVLKEMVGVDYEKIAIQFLPMTLDELGQFERSREEFYKMF
jgi:hypothetical protein